MSILQRRIHGEDYLSMPGYHPSSVQVSPTPSEIPAQAHVTYDNGTVLYGTLHPLVTADGATVPAAADVTYPETVPAGRP